ncbi:MAG: sigma-70 family RNA polymerase sigma factor [Bacteroidales bacterium]|nr:sigma-70 family RNA polymerase sigma factor [Bacteroidales bacterium]
MDIDANNIKSFQATGNQQAFGELMRKYKDRVFNFCLCYLEKYDDADDCTQEIFIKLYENLHTFRFEAKFSTWLYRIMINSCKNMKRSKHYSMRGRIQETDISGASLEEINNCSHSPEKVLINEELGRAIREAIQTLKGSQKMVLIMSDIDGRAYEEIAKITNFKIGTVKSKLARARLKVAEILKSKNIT